MDTSPEYIRQSDTPEIQERCKFDWNFWAIINHGEFEALTCVKGDGATYFNPSFYPIWLPRQDQLQILSGLTWVEFDDKCRKYWFMDGSREITKEQAGIRVVMAENHNKTWDNGWIDGQG